ncbi:hypothetical protein ACFFJB_01275 [Camelimonas abortus]
MALRYQVYAPGNGDIARLAVKDCVMRLKFPAGNAWSYSAAVFWRLIGHRYNEFSFNKALAETYKSAYALNRLKKLIGSESDLADIFEALTVHFDRKYYILNKMMSQDVV